MPKKVTRKQRARGQQPEKKRATIHMVRAVAPVVLHRSKTDARQSPVATRRTPPVIRPTTPISWQAPDFHLHPRGVTWSVFIVGTGIAAAILFALFEQYTLAVIVFLAGLVLVLGSSDQPQLLLHTVTPRGFLINNWLLSWNDIKSFWITAAPEGNKLHLSTVKRGLPVVTVYLGKMDPEVVRAELATYLPEHPTRGEQIQDILARLLRV
jgi:hypothetical protein